MENRPPIWADRFLEWFCNPDLLEEIQGDLYEIYDEKIRQNRKGLANFQFVFLVFRSFRYSVIARQKTQKPLLIMTRNNFKIAFRVLWKDKFNSALNMLGLAIGIASFFLMGNYVLQELRYDQFHSQKDRIHRVWLKEVYGEDKIFFNSVTPLRFEKLLEEHFSEFDEVVQYDQNSFLVGEGNDRNNEPISIISPEFFQVFDFQVMMGNAEKPLTDRNSIILSESHATKYFGNSDPMSKTLAVQVRDETREFTVTGVFKDLPKESSFQFDMAISTENNLEIYGEGAMGAWFSVSPETYVLLGENSSLNTVEQNLPSVVMSYLKGEVEEGVYNIGFQPLTDIHLNPEIPAGIAPVGNRDYVYILGLICLLIIIVACINYTTLSVGQSLKRSKEVGVRKIMGAFRSSLIGQYLSESVVITFFALLLGLGIAIVALPSFNSLTGADVVLKMEVFQLVIAVILVVVIGIASGLYPSVILSRLKVVSILQGSSKGGGRNYIRKGMVVFQFLITVFLISSTLIVKRQLDYMQTMDVGFDYTATVSVPLYPDPSARRLTDFIEGTMEKGEQLREKLSQYPEIADIGMGSHVFGTPGWGNVSYTDDTDIFRDFQVLFVDPYYFNTFDIKMLEGRAFEPESGLDKRQSIILNKAAVDYFGLESPLGKTLPGYEPGEHSIVGVTENFNFNSLHSDIGPLVISQNVGIIYSQVADHNYGDSPVPKVVFRYTGSQLSNISDILKREWEGTYPGEELNFNFVEENMRFQYESEARLNKLVVVASILSMIIASLGLLGLAVLVTNSRTKEIGIRKIVGASVPSIFRMLVNSFAVQLLLGAVLSVPFTYWLMSTWLEGFAFRVNVGPGVFIFSALVSIVVALLVITFHTLKAAMVNPVDSLKSE